MKKVILILTLTLCIFTVKAEEDIKFIKANNYVKNPLDLRDPFKKVINKKRLHGQMKMNQNGNYKNYEDNIETKPIEFIKIIGVLTGSERRAMAKVGLSPETYIIKEGMKLGPNQAEVKAILPGGIVLVEKIRNVYDQDEYLETVIPVSGE